MTMGTKTLRMCWTISREKYEIYEKKKTISSVIMCDNRIYRDSRSTSYSEEVASWSSGFVPTDSSICCEDELLPGSEVGSTKSIRLGTTIAFCRQEMSLIKILTTKYLC